MSTMPAVAESTYRQTFRGERSHLPLIHYKNLPCMYTENKAREANAKLPTSTNHARVPSPVKRHQGEPCKCPCTARGRVTAAKNKVFETKFGPMGMEEIDRLYNKTRYETFTHRASNEYGLPMYRPVPPATTKEEKPDAITLKGQVYENRREEWQDAVLWDRIQPRAPSQRPTTPAGERLLRRRHKTVSLKPCVESQIKDLVKKDGLANVFVRKLPGYAGYAPLCPPETSLDDKKEPVEMTSLMRATYTHFPAKEYMPQRYGRRGPLSQVVTLTFPFNPYNKVGDEVNAPPDKEGNRYGIYHWLL